MKVKTYINSYLIEYAPSENSIGCVSCHVIAEDKEEAKKILKTCKPEAVILKCIDNQVFTYVKS